MRLALRGLLLLLLLSLMVAGCRSADEFTGEFSALTLQEAPPELQRYYEQMKALPGLYVLPRAGKTYLLLVTGRIEPAGQRLEVMQVQRPAGPANEVRVLARLLPGGGTETYPYALVQLNGGQGWQFKARVATPDEQVLELRGMPIVDR